MSTEFLLNSSKKDLRIADGKSVIAECLQVDSERIYNDSVNIFQVNSQVTKLFQKSAVDYLSKDQGLTAFYETSSLEMSRKLLLHTETDFVDLDLNLLNPLQNFTIAKCWFSKKCSVLQNKSWSEILFPSSTSFPVGFTACENTLTRSRKIRVYPKSETRKTVHKYFGLRRYWFNKTVEYLKNPEIKANYYAVRKVLLASEVPCWALDCPQRIRAKAIEDAVVAVKNAKVKCKKTGKFNSVSFVSRKDPKQSFGFDKQSLGEASVFREKDMKVVFKTTENIPQEKLEGTELCYEKGRYFVVVPREITIKQPENQRLGVVAIDPGVRTFASFFNVLVSGEIGSGDFTRITRLCHSLDSLISGCTKQKLLKTKKKIDRIRWRIQDLIADLHHKVANFLVKSFDVIIIPSYNTHEMSKKLRSKTARAMMNWGFRSFVQFLKGKAEEYSCTIIDQVNEAYTSKTCTFCGKINKSLHGSKIFRCDCRENTWDRDYNGARNILLRALLALTETGNTGISQ